LKKDEVENLSEKDRKDLEVLLIKKKD